MSGIYIKGMEMPKDRPQLLWVYPNGKVMTLQSDVDPWKELQAASISPHGRLADVDAFIEKCEEMADKEDGNQLDALVLLRWFLEQYAPTIIPAEGDE